MKILKVTAVALVSFAVSQAAFSQSSSSSSSSMYDMHESHSQMHGSSKSNDAAAKAAFDHQFLDTMTAHHQGSIKMAQLASSRAAHGELKEMAKKMIEEQKSDIKQLQGWKDQWYAGKGSAMNMKMPGMHESMKGMRPMMKKLEAAKEEKFDAMFLDMMMKHHAGAVKMAQDALGKAEHQEVKQFAQKIVDNQTKEIEQMKKWKEDWILSTK